VETTTGTQHLEQAMLNEQLAMWLASREPERAASWAIIMLFYSALHYIDAYLEGVRAVSSPSHEAQDANIAADPEMQNRQVVERFQVLRQASIEARYRMRCFTVDEFYDYCNGYFLPIKHAVTELLDPNKISSRQD